MSEKFTRSNEYFDIELEVNYVSKSKITRKATAQVLRNLAAQRKPHMTHVDELVYDMLAYLANEIEGETWIP